MDINNFCQIIEAKTGLFFNESKKQFLERVIQKVIKKKCISSREYLQLLKNPLYSEREIKKLAELITVLETKFFRHPEQFEVLKEKIIPEILKNNKKIMIWSAGCATGEEAYSIAMVLTKLKQKFKDLSFKIYATDINNKALNTAQKGIYSLRSMTHVPEEYWEYFILSKDQAIVKKEIKRHVEFFHLNLVRQPFPVYCFTETDIIFCRNVFIYFRPESIKRVLNNFYLCLREEGYLFLAPTETLAGISEKFTVIKCKKTFIYKKTTPALPIIQEKIAPIENNKKTKTKEKILPISKLKEAKKLANIGQYEKATHILEDILKQYPTLPEIYLLLGIIYYEKGDVDNAIENLKKAISLTPSFSLAYFFLGNIYQNISKIAEANKMYKTILEIPENKVYYGILSEIMELVSHKELVNICKEYLKHN